MLSNWSISFDRVHLVVHGNTIYNMQLCIDYLNIKSMRCLIYSLQLVMTDSLLLHENLNSFLTKVCKICGHFNDSQSACKTLKEIQKELPSFTTVLLSVQGVTTRLISTFLMLQRLLSIYASIQNYLNNNLPDLIITKDEWKLIKVS